MNSDNLNLFSNEIGSALSEVLPNLYQLLKRYHISRTIGAYLVDDHVQLNQSLTNAEPPNDLCKGHWDPKLGAYVCDSMPESTLLVDSPSAVVPENSQLFCTDFVAQLSSSPRLKQFALQTDEDVKVHIYIDPSKEGSSSTVTCKIIEGVLQCSN
jgi:hypothetical protein